MPARPDSTPDALEQREYALLDGVGVLGRPVATDGDAQRFEAVIAVNDDVGDGRPVRLRDLDLDAYRKNPVVLFQHDRFSGLPVGRTLEIGFDDSGRLVADFEFLPEDPMAERVRNAWRRGYLRAASITFSAPLQGRPVLREWSIVSVPADMDAVIRGLHARQISDILDDPDHEDSRAATMPAKPVEVAAVVAEGDGNPPAQPTTVGERTAEPIEDDIVFSLLEKLTARIDDLVASSVERALRAAMPAEENSSPEEDDPEKEIRARASQRAELIHLASELLPSEFDTRAASDREILLAAVGPETPGADERSDDYLLAILHGIASRRLTARAATAGRKPSPGHGSAGFTRGPGIVELKRLQRQGRAD